MFDSSSPEELMAKAAIYLSAKIVPNMKLSPGAQKNIEVGLEQITSAIKFLTLPFALAGHSAEIIEEKYKIFLKNAFEKVPEEKIITPDPSISIPTVQNVIQVFDKNDIRELYVNLLASASNRDKKDIVHPSFPIIISQLDSLDVLILDKFRHQYKLPFLESTVAEYIDGLEYMPTFEPFTLIEGYEEDYREVAASLTTLSRLGLIRKAPLLKEPPDDKEYEAIFSSELYDCLRAREEKLSDYNRVSDTPIQKGYFEITSLGKKFINTCIDFDKDIKIVIH